MIRILRNLSFFLAGFFTVFYTGLTYAETIPATPEQTTVNYTSGTTTYGCTGWGTKAATPAAVCATGSNLHLGIHNGYAACLTSSNGYVCSINATCPGGWTFNSSAGFCQQQQTVYSCPSGQGWALNGQSCSRPDCLAGQVRDSGGICSNAYQTCAELVVTATGSCVKSVPCGPQSSTPLDSALASAAICSDQKSDPTNCAASGGIVIGTFQGKPICLSSPPDDPTCTALGGTVTGTLNGQPVCSNTAGNPPCPGGGASAGTLNGQPVCNGSCGSGSAPGTVNGVTSCYPIAPTTTKKTTQSSNSPGTSTTTTGNDPNNPAGTSTKQEATQCDGSRCSTTTIINNGDGTSSTTTKQEDQGDYCKSNPKASVCSGETEQDKYCEDNPESLGCMKAGTPVEEGGLSTVDKSVVSTISPVNIASSAGCPADVQLGKGVYITYAGVCQYAEGLRPVVLASAWLLAGLIVLGMTKGS